MYDLNDSLYIRSWAPYRGKFTLLVRFVLFIACFYAAAIVAAIPSSIASLIIRWDEFSAMVREIALNGMRINEMFAFISTFASNISSHPAVVGVNLISQGLVALGLILYVGKIERRPLVSIGVRTGASHVTYTSLAGVGLGVGMPLIAYLICRLSGAVITVGIYGNGAWLILFFVGLLVQAFSEELLYRGYFLSLFVVPGRSPWMGIAFVTLFYALPQIGVGMNIFGVMNAVLMGLLLSVLALRTGSIWLTVGLSATWNFMMVCIFGTSYLPTIWRVLPLSGKELLSGSIGVDGGLVMALVLLVALTCALFIPSWKRSIVPTDTSFRF